MFKSGCWGESWDGSSCSHSEAASVFVAQTKINLYFESFFECNPFIADNFCAKGTFQNGKVTVVICLHVVRRHVLRFLVASPFETLAHQSSNRPPADYWSVLCISVFIWASLFPTLLTTSERRHDEEKTPSNRSAERPISHSTICPSNDYLAAVWCDTLGWRGSIANILSLSLYISPQHSTTDDTWSGLSLFNTQNIFPSCPFIKSKRVGNDFSV